MPIDRPIFILGPHRSGTTLLYESLAQHPSLGYLNRANRRVPFSPHLARAMTLVGLGMSDSPMEAQNIWDRFRTRDDDWMGAADAPARVTDWHRWQVSRALSLRGAGRFLAKYPRLSLRLEWLDAMFPDAIFIHLKRDWRAVVSSTVGRRVKREERGGGWFGIRVPGWHDLADLPHAVASARIFRTVTHYLEEEGPWFGDRYFAVRYEDLCENPLAVFGEIVERCDLPMLPEFQDSLPRSLESANHKWRDCLSEGLIRRIRAEDPRFYARHEETDSSPHLASV